MKLDVKTIVLIGFGAFVAYNLAVLGYAFTKEKGIFRVTTIAVYAPWLLISKDFGAWVFNA